MHLGIDYGAKLAGTTVICYEKDKQLELVQSEKKQDADQFILNHLAVLQPKSVFIDAPLSLPLAYFGKGDNYFFRVCDRELQAMSPMFLGGLTARAIRLINAEETTNISFKETYPAQIVRHYLTTIKGYKKQKTYIAPFCDFLSTQLPLTLACTPQNWHQIDALLAWWAGWRYQQGAVKTYGEEIEGFIYI